MTNQPRMGRLLWAAPVLVLALGLAGTACADLGDDENDVGIIDPPVNGVDPVQPAPPLPRTGPDGDEPHQFGDDPVLDVLYEDCRTGEFDSCDELWWTSPTGSEYERFGLTCGDRVAEEDAEPGGCSESPAQR